jgi:hypothetical protein
MPKSGKEGCVSSFGYRNRRVRTKRQSTQQCKSLSQRGDSQASSDQRIQQAPLPTEIRKSGRFPREVVPKRTTCHSLRIRDSRLFLNNVCSRRRLEAWFRSPGTPRTSPCRRRKGKQPNFSFCGQSQKSQETALKPQSTTQA